MNPAETSTAPTCAFVTFGCKINFYDTQAIREAVLDLGYQEMAGAADGRGLEGLDLVVINCCTVTGRAGDHGGAAVRRMARRNPEATILVTGCLTPEDRTALTGIPGVEYVIGNEEKDQIPALLQGADLAPTRGRRSRAIFNLQTSRFDRRTRAYLKIHDGCDSFCSYCIIPFVRGKSKSRAATDVLAEATRMAEAGHREVVVTGIHLSQYGRDIQDQDLVGLLRALRAIPGLDRVRLSSIGEGAFNRQFMALFSEDPGYCRFFHIPLQSGSDTVLARMRRGYDSAVFLDTVERVRQELPDAQITTDLMVGFPGETEREFEESLETCLQARFGSMHVFPYSPRPGTRAAGMGDPVVPEVRRQRLARARKLEAELARSERRRRMGSSMKVLVEKVGNETAVGTSREGFKVVLEAAPGAVTWNQEIAVRVVGESPAGQLVGEFLERVSS